MENSTLSCLNHSGLSTQCRPECTPLTSHQATAIIATIHSCLRDPEAVMTSPLANSCCCRSRSSSPNPVLVPELSAMAARSQISCAQHNWLRGGQEVVRGEAITHFNAALGITPAARSQPLPCGSGPAQPPSPLRSPSTV